MIDRNDMIKLSKNIFDYILKLDDKDIKLLIEGSKKIAIVENNKVEKVKSTSSNSEEIEIISKQINSFKTREEVDGFFASNNFTVKKLKELAKFNNVYIKNSYTKSMIIEKIIEGTVGAYLKIKILKGEM